jgi:methyl-accepting chemotaxis protein
MATFRIKDMSIATKSLVAPVIGALITVAIVIVVITVTNGAARLAGQAEAAERLAMAVTAARLAFAEGHAALFRAVSWRAGHVSPKQVDDARNEARTAIARADEMMQNLPATDDVRTKVDALKKLVSDYQQAVKQTTEMIQEDVFIATMMMTDAHDKSLHLASAFQEFADETVAESSALSARAKEALQQGVNVILATAVTGIVLALGLAVICTRLLSRPVKLLTIAVSRLAEGDLSAAVPADDRSDEIGAMTRAVDVLKRNSQEMRRLQAEQRDAEAGAAVKRRADMDQLANSFETAVSHIVDAVSSAAGELEGTALTLARAAETTQQLSSVVTGASQLASNNVQSVATLTDDLSASVTEISRRVGESSRIASEAVRQAEITDARINELSKAASCIGDVVKLITAIAEQTNLLALNATIEAARAGEAGRGFAVVASEVKSLANQTAKATEEIGSQIAGMQTATNDSVAAIREIGATIGRISEITSDVSMAVQQQGTAAQEISSSVQEAAKGTSHVAANIANVNRAASGTGSASSRLLAAAKALSAQGNHLKSEADKFLVMVRAA